MKVSLNQSGGAMIGLLAASSGQDLHAIIRHIVPDGNAPGVVLNAANTTINWDIDLDGRDDFVFLRSSTFWQNNAKIQRTGIQNTGAGFVTEGYRFAWFNSGETITAAVPSGDIPFTWGYYNPVKIIESTTGILESQAYIFLAGSYPNNTFATSHLAHFTLGFRFRLDESADFYYGWVNVQASGLPNASIYFTDWAYNTEPNETLKAKQVPEPTEAVLGLAGLALGAAGLRRWRQTRKG